MWMYLFLLEISDMVINYKLHEMQHFFLMWWDMNHKIKLNAFFMSILGVKIVITSVWINF